MNKAERLRKLNKAPETKIKLFWRLFKNTPYAEHRLWLFCAENSYVIPEEQLDKIATWIQNRHDKYIAKGYKINQNRLSRRSARMKWLHHYYKGSDFKKDEFDLFNAYIKGIVIEYDEQRNKKRAKQKLNEKIFEIYWNLIGRGHSKTKAIEHIAERLKLSISAIKQRIYEHNQLRKELL